MEYFDGTICFLYTMMRLNRLMQWYMELELSGSTTVGSKASDGGQAQQRRSKEHSDIASKRCAGAKPPIATYTSYH